MPVYMKRFVYASLAYLAAAAILGFANAIPDVAYLVRFAHIHLALLGFMSMMIFGIGYFILPRFNGLDLAHPSWVTIHFWLANASLIGMVTAHSLATAHGGGASYSFFIGFALLQVLSIFMFVVNIGTTLSQKIQPAPSGRMPLSGADRIASPRITADTRVADLIDAHSPVKEYLIAAGLSPLALPGHLDKVRQMGVTVGMACRSHGLDPDTVISGIESLISDQAISRPNKTLTLRGDMLIGDVLQNWPETRPIFQRHFGDGCFDCPGQAFESVTMACKMHGIDESQFLLELAAAAK